jgi:poly-gamma-glutamate synthesis protein (capsule biosynthesis protein)
VIPTLKKHFHAYSVANNHAGDFGPEAFAEQCDLFDKAGIQYFGGGRDLKAAHTPLIIEKHGLRIALLGYCEVFLRSFAAGEKRPGCAWSEDDDKVLADIRAAREVHKADIVIPYMHWGDEHDPANDRQKSLARKMIDAGATCVIGGHPHVVQETEHYKGKPIIYSVGNFVFNGFEEPEANIGWALRMTLDKNGVAEWDTITARLDPRGVPIPDLKAKSPAGKRGDDAIQMRAPESTQKK